MAKTLNQFIEGYLKVKSADEQKFIDKHVTAKNPDRNGNGDDVFKGSTKTIDRRKDRKGYNPGEDEKVYEDRVRVGTLAQRSQAYRDEKAELKGNQHKIDANKNGKVDAHDFHLLRKKKKVAEEVEQIDELEKKTLGSYIKKASGAEQPKNVMSPKNVPLTKIAAYQGDSETGHFGKRFNQATYDKAERLRKNRETGIKRATDKLTKEEVEELDELSKATLGSYVVKSLAPSSEKSVSNLASKGGYKLGKARSDDYTAGEKEDAKSVKRSLGVLTAVRKMTKEQSELDEKLTAKTPMGKYIKDFQKSDAPQFKGKSQKKRQVMAIAAKLSAERGGKPLRKEEHLQNCIDDLSESHQRTLMHVFEKLSEDNKSKFLEACDTPEGVEQMLDFAINHRGE